MPVAEHVAEDGIDCGKFPELVLVGGDLAGGCMVDGEVLIGLHERLDPLP